jgi:3-phosphoshikimate 1-carboxyvinyltransferase
MSGSVSSQYLSALLMAAALAQGEGYGIEIIITDQLVSQPYVVMTIKLMERFGVEVRRLNPGSFSHPHIFFQVFFLT